MKARNAGIIFMLGALVGGIAAIFMPDDKRKKSKKFIEDNTKMIADKLRENDTTAAAMKVFDSKSKQAVAAIEKSRVELVKQLNKLKVAVDKIDKAKYQKAVEQTVSQLKDAGTITAKQVGKLTSYLKSDYEKLQK